jgi:effector-binding domain-containing protein
MSKCRIFGLFLLLAVVIPSLSLFAQVDAEKKEAPQHVYLKTTEPRTFAIMAHQGPFGDIPTVMANLIKAIDEGGYHMTGPVMCTYFNSPQEVAEKDLAWEVRIPVVYPGPMGRAENDKMGFGYSVPTHVAYIYHVGPYEKVGDTYKILFDWIAKMKYTIEGPPSELYWSDPERTPKEELVTEIWIPVKEKEIPGALR